MKKTPSKAIKAELLRIQSENGGILQPETVVMEARNPKSPLHSKFEWDDTDAAHEFRLLQARNLIRVIVHKVNIRGKEVPERVFVSLRADRVQEHGGYRKLSVVLSDADMRAALLSEAMAEMEYFREKYSRLKELAEVFAAMRKANSKLSKKKAA